MRDKYKAAIAMYRKTLRDLPCEAIGAIMKVLLNSGFVLSRKDRATNVTRYYHKKRRELVACFDPRGGPKNIGCGMPCICIFRRLRPNAKFQDNSKTQDLMDFALIDNIHLLYIDESSLQNIVSDAKEFMISFNERIGREQP